MPFSYAAVAEDVSESAEQQRPDSGASHLTYTLADARQLLGLLREEKCFAAEILHEHGLRLSAIREELSRR